MNEAAHVGHCQDAAAVDREARHADDLRVECGRVLRLHARQHRARRGVAPILPLGRRGGEVLGVARAPVERRSGCRVAGRECLLLPPLPCVALVPEEQRRRHEHGEQRQREEEDHAERRGEDADDGEEYDDRLGALHHHVHRQLLRRPARRGQKKPE